MYILRALPFLILITQATLQRTRTAFIPVKKIGHLSCECLLKYLKKTKKKKRSYWDLPRAWGKMIYDKKTE
jgi:hypothetical protein